MFALLPQDVRYGLRTLARTPGFTLVGLHGVMCFAVSTRTQEIGIRMALGAQARDVMRMILHKSAAGTMLGTGASIGLALLIGRVFEVLLFSVTPTDPGTFVVVTGLLVGVAAVASYLPARRATKVDPVVALRHE